MSATRYLRAIEISHTGLQADVLIPVATTNDDIVETITADQIPLAEGSVLVGNAAGAAAAVSAKTSGRILVGDGTTVASVAVGTDATLAANGALTIAANVVSFAKMEAACRTWFNAIRSFCADGLLIAGTLAKSATAKKFKTTATLVYTINGVTYTKAATDNLTFTAGHVVTASKNGVILFQIDAAGTISSKVPLATQAYDTMPLALAALPAADALNVAIGHAEIINNAGDWTANTDDIVDGVDVTSFSLSDTVTKTLPAAL